MSGNGAGKGGGALLKFSVGRSGAAPAHLAYITRGSATQGAHERVWTRNIPGYAAHPDHAEQGLSYEERTADLREYVRQYEEDELDAGRERQNGAGQNLRTHYRAIYSFDRAVADEQMKELVNRHLAEHFPRARAVAAIHRDTDHPHVHVQLAARQTDGRKLHFSHHRHRRLDEAWARIYGQAFGLELEREHLAKKAQWRAWMQAAREAKERGETIPPRPRRATHERNQLEERRQMLARQELELAGPTHPPQPPIQRAEPAERVPPAAQREHADGSGAPINPAALPPEGTSRGATEQRIQAGHSLGLELLRLVYLQAGEPEGDKSQWPQVLTAARAVAQLRGFRETVEELGRGHEAQYGAPPRMVLRPEERDYLQAHAAEVAHPAIPPELREQFRAAFILGETPWAEGFEQRLTQAQRQEQRQQRQQRQELARQHPLAGYEPAKRTHEGRQPDRQQHPSTPQPEPTKNRDPTTLPQAPVHTPLQTSARTPEPTFPERNIGDSRGGWSR